MDAQRWTALCERLGCTGLVRRLETLEAAYSEPHRHYHTAAHVQECLDLFDETNEEPEHPDEVELAMWFRHHREAAARRNLSRAIERLGGGSGA